jgi:glycosyl transferase family 25
MKCSKTTITIIILTIFVISIVAGMYLYANLEAVEEGFKSLNKTKLEQLDIDSVIYINLDSRQDRNEEILKELSQINMPSEKIHRLSAIKRSWGALGASLSHVACMKFIQEKGWKRTLILEDDAGFEFRDVERWNAGVIDVNKKLNSEDYDVIFLGGFVRDPTGPLKTDLPTLFQTKNTSCGHAYIVKGSYAPKIQECLETGIQMIMKNPPNKEQFHLDNAWTSIMKMDKWFVTIPTLAFQRESYSDIEGKLANTDAPLRGEVVRAWKQGTVLS